MHTAPDFVTGGLSLPEEDDMAARVIANLIGQVLGAAIGALIGALIVQLATKLVAKYKPPYRMAYKAVFLGYLASAVIGFVIGLMIGASGGTFNETVFVMTMVIGFFAASAIYAPLIKSPANEPLGFGRACMVSLIQVIIGGLILGAILLIVLAVIK